MLLFLYPFSFSIRSLSCCARVFGVEGVSERFASLNPRYGKLGLWFGVFFLMVCALFVKCMVGSVIRMDKIALHAWFGSFSWLLQWRTVARPINLAQASLSRLGEMKQGDLCTRSRPGDSLNFWASRHLAQARGISLKRDPVMPTHLILCPRLGEGEARLSETSSLSEIPQPERGVWARRCGLECVFDL